MTVTTGCSSHQVERARLLGLAEAAAAPTHLLHQLRGQIHALGLPRRGAICSRLRTPRGAALAEPARGRHLSWGYSRLPKLNCMRSSYTTARNFSESWVRPTDQSSEQPSQLADHRSRPLRPRAARPAMLTVCYWFSQHAVAVPVAPPHASEQLSR